MQTDNPLLDGLAKFFTDAAGAANSVRNEIDTFMRQRLEKLVADMDFVPREEFEMVKAMAAKARTENERLAARVAGLGGKLPATAIGGDAHIGFAEATAEAHKEQPSKAVNSDNDTRLG